MKRSVKHSNKSSLIAKMYARELPRIPLLFQIVGLFIFWALYRFIFHLPEWFDEIFVKALVFGGPAFLYARHRVDGQERLGLGSKNFWCGMYLGLLIGGVYGFVGASRTLIQGVHIEPIMLFSSSAFWWQFFLAIMTSWWESLFFFGYVMNAVQEEYRLPEYASVVVSTIVFVAFHAPLRLVLMGWNGATAAQLAILGLFAIGQAILFLRSRSIFAITLSQALWGMVLLVYGVQ